MELLQKNFKYLLRKFHTNSNELSIKLNGKPPQSTLHRIEEGQSKEPRRSTLKPIADWAGITTEELTEIDLEERDNNKDTPQLKIQSQPKHMNFIPPVDLTHSKKPRETPVLSWVQAGDFSYVLSSDLSSAIDWIPYDPRAGQYGFALIVKGVSMEPDFKPDEFIYINPTYQIDELNTGALVVMACDGDSEATFKELVAEDGDYYLRPLNPNWKPQLIQVDHTCRLVGKVVGKYTRY